MKVMFARALLRLARAILGERNSAWASAMRSELDEAVDVGEPVSFAFGCLIASLRHLPAHGEGRLRIVMNMLALLMIVPLSGLQIGNALLGLPSLLGKGGIAALFASGSKVGGLVTGVYGATFPLIFMLAVLLALAHLRIAWTLLERDWARLTASCAFALAVSVTLTLLMGALLLDIRPALLQVLLLVSEFVTIGGIVLWHSQMESSRLQGINSA